MTGGSTIREHMTVVGSDGEHVGIVDHVAEGGQIKLTKTDPDAGGEHHYLPLDWVTGITGGQVRLNRPGAEAKQQWK